jgi:hypothetical protein
VFVAGGLLWGNMRDRAVFGTDNPIFYLNNNGEMYVSAHGIPLVAMNRYWYTPPKFSASRLIMNSHNRFSYSSAALDFAAALSVLFAVYFLCEWLIRRRVAK